MTRKLILTALAALPFLAAAQQTFTVKGQIGTVGTPAKAYLVYQDNGQRTIDSSEVSKGVFTFSGEVSQPSPALLAIDHEGVGIAKMEDPDLIEFFVESGEIQIQGAGDSISMARLSGTPLNIDQQRFNEALAAVSKKEEVFLTRFESSTEEERASAEFRERIEKEYEALQEEKGMVYMAYIKDNPGSLISLNALAEYAGPNPDPAVIEPLLSALSPQIQQSPLGIALRQQLERSGRLDIGAQAPDFTQNDPDGTPVALSSFKGKYVLLDFWASWCGPCRKENPNLVAAYNKFKDKNFTILGISLDRETGRDAWLKAVADDQLSWTQVSDLKFWENEVARLYDVKSIPQSFLLDPNGKIIAKNLRGEELHKALEELLN